MNTLKALGLCGFVALGLSFPAAAMHLDPDDLVYEKIRNLRLEVENFKLTMDHDHRDIFTMYVIPEEPERIVRFPNLITQKAEAKPAKPVLNSLTKLMAHERKAYNDLRARKYTAAFEQAELGLQVIDKGETKLIEDTRTVGLESSLHRIRATAQRLGHRSKAEKEFAALGLQVQAVVHSKEQGLVIVDSRVLREGSRIKGAQVVRIDPTAAEFLYDGIRIRVPLHFEKVRK
jgi:hypothetical protein